VADGIHLYALGWEDLVPDILARAGIGAGASQPAVKR
jgi:hypothetical protein